MEFLDNKQKHFIINCIINLDGTAFGLPSAPFGVFLGSEKLRPSGHKFPVGGFSFFGSFNSRSSSSFLASFSLKSNWSDESLDLWCLGSGFGVLFISFQFSSDDKRSDIVFLFEIEQFSDLVSSFWSQSSVNNGVGQTGDFVVTFSDDAGGDNGQIVVNDATSDGFSLSFTGSFAGVSRSALFHEKSNSMSDEDTLFHGETLFIFTSGDSKNVSFEFIAQWIGGYFVGDSLLVEVLDLVFIIDFEGFLLACARVSDIDFHNGISRLGVFCKFDLRL